MAVRRKQAARRVIPKKKLPVKAAGLGIKKGIVKKTPAQSKAPLKSVAKPIGEDPKKENPSLASLGNNPTVEGPAGGPPLSAIQENPFNPEPSAGPLPSLSAPLANTFNQSPSGPPPSVFDQQDPGGYDDQQDEEPQDEQPQELETTETEFAGFNNRDLSDDFSDIIGGILKGAGEAVGGILKGLNINTGARKKAKADAQVAAFQARAAAMQASQGGGAATPKSNNTMIFIAAGAVVLILVLFFVLKKKK